MEIERPQDSGDDLKSGEARWLNHLQEASNDYEKERKFVNTGMALLTEERKLEKLSWSFDRDVDDERRKLYEVITNFSFAVKALGSSLTVYFPNLEKSEFDVCKEDLAANQLELKQGIASAEEDLRILSQSEKTATIAQNALEILARVQEIYQQIPN